MVEEEKGNPLTITSHSSNIILKEMEEEAMLQVEDTVLCNCLCLDSSMEIKVLTGYVSFSANLWRISSAIEFSFSYLFIVGKLPGPAEKHRTAIPKSVTLFSLTAALFFKKTH